MLAVAALIVQATFGTGGLGGLFGGGGQAPADVATTPSEGDAIRTATEVGQAPATDPLQVADSGMSAVQATATAASNAPGGGGAGLPPGLFFFAGGALVILLVFSLWYVRGFPRRSWE